MSMVLLCCSLLGAAQRVRPAALTSFFTRQVASSVFSLSVVIFWCQRARDEGAEAPRKDLIAETSVREDRTISTHKDVRRGVPERSRSFLVLLDGSPFPGAFLQGSVHQNGLLRLVHFYLNQSPEAVALGTQDKLQVTQVKVFSFMDSVELKDGQKACRFFATRSRIQVKKNPTPKLEGARGPANKRTSRKGKFRDGSAVREVPIAWRVTSQRPSTPAPPPPHCSSTAPRVSHRGWSRFPVGAFSGCG